MLESMKVGLSVAVRRSLIIIMLFLYEMIWGFILYRFVSSIAVPILYRYPGAELPSWASLFWIEGEFRLLKTDMADTALMLLLAMLIGRMLITPLINAGVFYSVQHQSVEQRRAFMDGIRSLWKRFFLLYVLQMALTALPLIWLIPSAEQLIYSGEFTIPKLVDAALILTAYGLYIALLRLIFMYLQFASAAGETWSRALFIWMKRLFPLVGLSAAILIITIILQSALASASLLWAGLTALIIYQATPLLRVFCQIWEIASQHELWSRNRATSD